MYKNIKLLKNVNEINNSLNKSCYISNTCFTKDINKNVLLKSEANFEVCSQ